MRTKMRTGRSLGVAGAAHACSRSPSVRAAFPTATPLRLAFAICAAGILSAAHGGSLRADASPWTAGNRLNLDLADTLNDSRSWSLIVTEISHNRVQGLLRRESGVLYDLNLPKEAWHEVAGTVNGLGTTLTAKKYDPQQQAWKDALYLQLVVQNETVRGKWGRDENLRHGVRVKSIDRLPRSESERMVREHQAAIEKGRTRWADLRPIIAALRDRGHELRVGELLETGDVALTWSDYASGTYVEGRYVAGRGEYVKDYQMLEELRPLGYVHHVELDKITAENDVRFVAAIPAVGMLRIRNLTGRQLATMSGIGQVRMLDLPSINDAALKELAAIQNLEGVKLWTNKRAPRGDFTPSSLSLLKSLPKLKCIHLGNYEHDLRDVLTFFEGMESLELLDLTVQELGDRSVAALQGFPRLKSLKVNKLTADQLVAIQSDSLERLRVENLRGLNDDLLTDWRVPSRLQQLRVPYWTPEDTLTYIRRLRTMPDKEYSLYQAIRWLEQGLFDVHELYHRERQNINDRMELALLGGMAGDVKYAMDRQPLVREALQALQESGRAERTIAGLRRATARQLLLSGRKAQQLLAELVAAGTLKSECAIQAQLTLYSTSGALLPSLVEQIEPAWLTKRKAYYDGLKKLAEM